MQHSPRKKAWVLGAVLISTATLSTSALWFDSDGEPPLQVVSQEDKLYVEWIRSIEVDETIALESGLKILAQYPDFSRLYIRLADLCAHLDGARRCTAALRSTVPRTAKSALYRKAALHYLGAAEMRWPRIVESPHLDPELARWIVDHLRRDRAMVQLDEIERVWEELFAADSSGLGASFGLGYAAVLRNDWERAAPHLNRAARLAPHDAHAFRELARMYYFTANYDGFVDALEKGIANARSAHDLEHEVILRGNLGLGYLQWEGDLTKAAEMFETSYAQAKSLNMGSTIAIGGYRLANVWARQHRYEDALAVLDSAEVWYEQSAPERMSELLSLRGQILEKMYRYSESAIAIQQSLVEARSHDDKIREAQALHALAQLATKTGQFEQAREAANSALGAAEGLGTTDYVISTLSLLGEIERLSGRYPDAERHLRRGLEIAESTKSVARIAELSRELGITALINGNTEEAGGHFDTANRALGDGGRNQSDALLWTALTYAFYQSYPQAEKTYQAALDSLRSRDKHLEGFIKLRLANVKKTVGKTEEAMSLLEEAGDVLGDDPIQRSLVSIVRGQIYLRQGEYRRALSAFNNAKSAPWLSANWEIEYGIAQGYWGLGMPRKAEDAFRSAMADIESKRDKVSSTVGRSYFVADRNAVYDSFAAFLEDEGRLEEAVNISERARSRGLVDLIYTTQSARGSSAGDVKAKAIDAFVRTRAVESERREIKLSSERDAARSEFLVAEQENLSETYARLERSLRGSHPLFTFSPARIEDVRRDLQQDEAALVFLLREDWHHNGAESVVYVVSRDTVRQADLAVGMSDVRTLVNSLNERIRNSRGSLNTGWEHVAEDLYTKLIAPTLPLIGPGTGHLHIVPSGPLYYLPFGALLDGNGRFMVESYSLSVVPSLTVLRMSRARNPRQWQRILVLADPDGDLPGARHEGHMIAALDSAAHQLAVGLDATQSLLEDQARDHDIIHLATHGQFRSDAPQASHLKLHDDILSLDEIGRLNLNAYLVVLSACETALSKGMHPNNAAAEEWIGMHQAFLAAGTPTVIASLWTIHDRYSGPLMSRFYQQLGAAGKAKALASVQRRFIEDARIAHPYFWAGFIVIGDPL